MKLYHGTTRATALNALVEGLKPRSLTNKSNWKHLVESNPSMVYLTSTYAPYYAIGAAGENETHLGIIEIETDTKGLTGRRLLDKHLFRPDEDYISSSKRFAQDPRIKNVDTESGARKVWIRDNLHKFRNNWKESIKCLGNCCYEGVIPPGSITRVTIADIKKVSYMISMAAQASINEWNYAIKGEYYQLITRWFNKQPVTIDDWLSVLYDTERFPLPKEQYSKMVESWKKPKNRALVEDQSGLEVIFDHSVNNEAILTSNGQAKG